MDIVERLDVLADECRLECGGFTGDGLIFCKAAEEIRRLREERDDAREQRRKWHEASALDRAECQRLQVENERLRAALQRIADCKEPEFDGHNTAVILSGIAWAALALE